MFSHLVPLASQHRIREFVDEVFLPRAVTISPVVPDAMIDRSAGPSEDGWVPWKPIESPVTDDDILGLESAIGDSLPPLFRGWLMYKCLLMTDMGIVRLPAMSSDDPLQDIRVHVEIMDSQPFFRPRQVVPFASESNDVGPLCFDLKKRMPDGDCPVVLFDHELLSQSEYAGSLFADSFADLLDKIEADFKFFDEQQP